MCYQILELFSTCHCLFYQHAVDRCWAYGRAGHTIQRREILCGYTCHDHQVPRTPDLSLKPRPGACLTSRTKSVHSTISKDRTDAECVRQASMFAAFGQRLRGCPPKTPPPILKQTLDRSGEPEEDNSIAISEFERKRARQQEWPEIPVELTRGVRDARRVTPIQGDAVLVAHLGNDRLPEVVHLIGQASMYTEHSRSTTQTLFPWKRYNEKNRARRKRPRIVTCSASSGLFKPNT